MIFGLLIAVEKHFAVFFAKLQFWKSWVLFSEDLLQMRVELYLQLWIIWFDN